MAGEGVIGMVITGHAQILRSRLGPDSEGAVNLDKIQGASDGAASLTRVLLDFSRTSLVHPEWVSLNNVMYFRIYHFLQLSD